MFRVGDLVVYGSKGVCEVMDITTIDWQGIDRTQPYYVLKPLHQNCVVSTPTNNKHVPMRPIISRDEAERLIDRIPSIHAQARDNLDSRRLSEEFDAALNSHDCAKLIELTISLHTKKRHAEQHKRKLTAADERFMKQAEELLFGELSVVLGVPKDEVPEYIASRLDRAS